MQGESNIYINAAATISPQRTFDGEFPAEVVNYPENVLNCQVPDFKNYIPAAQLRRLSRMLRIGLTTSLICLKQAGLKSPDGIITATGYGFLEDTEKFLRELIERGERQLTPTYFMQGTYNALAGLIGLSIQCTGYNNTYLGKGYALGSALDDAMLQIHEKPAQCLLVGGYDEAVNVQYKSVKREGHFKTEFVDSLELFGHPTPGSLQGEGCSFFLLSGSRTAQTLCVLKDILGIFSRDEDLNRQVVGFLEKNHVAVSDVDLWIGGHSGDGPRDAAINALGSEVLDKVPHARFKHLVGEYSTADGFALWLGATVLKTQSVPQAIRYGNIAPKPALRHVLIVNHYLGGTYTLYLLQQA